MKAMIFAAGLGTRLRPLTNNKPKALVEVGGMPLLEIAIRRLMFFGVRKVLINIHHFGEQILAFLQEKNNFDIEIVISDERDQLLDTGGGLKKAAWYFREAPFLVYNTDVISSLSLSRLYEAHLATEAMATLAVRERTSSRYLLFNDEGLLAGWRHAGSGEERICRPARHYHPLAFSGIHVLSPAIFNYMPREEAVFSIIDTYLGAGGKEKIKAFRHDDTSWLDVGKLPALEQAQSVIQSIPLA